MRLTEGLNSINCHQFKSHLIIFTPWSQKPFQSLSLCIHTHTFWRVNQVLVSCFRKAISGRPVSIHWTESHGRGSRFDSLFQAAQSCLWRRENKRTGLVCWVIHHWASFWLLLAVATDAQWQKATQNLKNTSEWGSKSSVIGGSGSPQTAADLLLSMYLSVCCRLHL